MPDLTKIVKSHSPSLESYESLYKHIHSNPELSGCEHETAATVSSHLSKITSDFTQHTHIGLGTGLAAVLKNGDGPTVLLRADMDALPLPEKTGLEYASKKRMKDAEGKEQPVMHACGHDMHITCLLAASELLYKAREEWSGTLVVVFQPAEENGKGARAMVDDGLYDKVPVPDVVLGGHVFPTRAGSLTTRRGLLAPASDSLQITLHGSGGHASQPDRTIDPIIMASSTVLRLQTIVSREMPPGNGTVLTVSAIHAGEAANIIADEAQLRLNTRNMDPDTREKTLQSIQRIVKAESDASNAPKAPEIKELATLPFTVNDEDITAKLEDSFSKHFGEGQSAYDRGGAMMRASEDFSTLGTSVDRPCCFFLYGGTDPQLFDRAKREGRFSEDVPFNHSPYFAPVVQPTMRTGMEAYAVAALTWLVKK